MMSYEETVLLTHLAEGALPRRLSRWGRNTAARLMAIAILWLNTAPPAHAADLTADVPGALAGSFPSGITSSSQSTKGDTMRSNGQEDQDQPIKANHPAKAHHSKTKWIPIGVVAGAAVAVAIIAVHAHNTGYVNLPNHL